MTDPWIMRDCRSRDVFVINLDYNIPLALVSLLDYNISLALV